MSDAEASSLVPLFPGDDSDSFGVAWTLVHIVESAPSSPIDQALESASGPWAGVLGRRAGR